MALPPKKSLIFSKFQVKLFFFRIAYKLISLFFSDKMDEMLIQFDEQISTVGSLLGIQHGSSGRQCEVSKIVKKLAGLAFRIDSNTVEKLSRNVS